MYLFNIFWRNNIKISEILIYNNCVIMARELTENINVIWLVFYLTYFDIIISKFPR